MARVIPFIADHLQELVHISMKEVLDREVNGPAFTAVDDDGNIIACAGVYKVGPGVGYAWVVPGKKMEHYGLWVTRIIKLFLRDIKRSLKLERVEAFVPDRKNVRWIKMLGFRNDETRFVL